MLALICFGVTAKAQDVCKISGSNDSVEIFSKYIDVENNQIVVTIGNDSNDISANVTITGRVEGAYRDGRRGGQDFSGKTIAKPNQTTEIRITLPGGTKLDGNTKITAISISGTKCL
jgi:hypothetical protein